MRNRVVEGMTWAHARGSIEPSPGSAAMCLVLWVPDLDRAYEAATDAGAVVVSPPHPAGNGNRSALLRGPDGNLVELVAKV